MAKKKKFGMDDALALTAHAATLLGNFKDAQKAASKSKESKSFDEGAKTNLKAAEGGASRNPKLGTQDPGMSQLNKRYKQNHMY